MQAVAQVIVGLAALTVLIGAALQDLRERLIDNRFSVLLLLLGCVRHAVTADGWAHGIGTVAAALAAAAAVFVVGYALWRLGGIGGGDVKLLVATVFVVGVDGIGVLLAGTALGGGVLALLCVLWPLVTDRLAVNGCLPVTMHAAGARPTVPYGVAIAAGGAWALVPALPLLFG